MPKLKQCHLFLYSTVGFLVAAVLLYVKLVPLILIPHKQVMFRFMRALNANRLAIASQLSIIKFLITSVDAIFLL